MLRKARGMYSYHCTDFLPARVSNNASYETAKCNSGVESQREPVAYAWDRVAQPRYNLVHQHSLSSYCFQRFHQLMQSRVPLK